MNRPFAGGWPASGCGGIDLDDIIQETYAILAALESVDVIRNAKAYMFQTAYSVILAQVRRAQIVSISTINYIGQLADADGAPSPETVVSDRQELQRLADAIAALPDRCREVFVLRKIHGLQQRDVAQRLGVSEGTVEKQLHRGLNLVIAMFGRGGNPPRQASTRRTTAVLPGTQMHEPAGDIRGHRRHRRRMGRADRPWTADAC